MSIKAKVALVLEAVERQARASEREGRDDVSNTASARAGFLGEARGLNFAARELRRFFREGDLEPVPGAREILTVHFGDREAAEGQAEMAEIDGRTNVRVVREKIRVESTWRWGWVVVADAAPAAKDRP